MTNYKQLAIKYLLQNKKRTGLTILGVALSAMILFAFFNSMVSLYMTQRDACREQVKYEVVFWCESREVAEALVQEKYIKDFKRMRVQKPESGLVYENALCVSFKHPYQMNVYLERAAEEYGVAYDYTELAEYYFATGEDNILLIVALTVLLFAYIFAIFGVAVVRNSIQLISLEQLKDYGILRCIGCTKEQLKRVVYFMGFILEMSGMVLGIGLGFLVYLVIATKADLDIGFHVIGIPFIVLAFLGDLYFVMQENCKFVNKLTPVAAVRGEFKMNQKELKAHGKSIVGCLFGVEGEYAVKNLKRNPARMWKSVGAMAMGIAMVVVAVSVCSTIMNYVTQDSRRYGRYQIVNAAAREPGIGMLYYEDYLLPQEWLDKLDKCEQVTANKKVYEAVLYTTNPMLMQEHETESLRMETAYGWSRNEIAEKYREGDWDEDAKRFYELVFAANELVGYDKEDYERLGSRLVDGTLDVSEDGIVLVNGVYTMKEDAKMLNEVWAEYTVTDFQVGDSIEFVDFKEFDLLMQEKIAEIDLQNSDMEALDNTLIRTIMHDCYVELISKGKTRTYIIEGIVERDVNRFSMKGGAKFVLPLERYLEETGFTEEMHSGTMYHLEGHGLDDTLQELLYSGDRYYADTDYLAELDTLGAIWNLVVGAAFFVLFVVIISLLNISNTTASDLYLRRKEFAQLRVLGMSKRRLIFTVLLEGIFVAVLADVLGVALGYGIVKCIVEFINIGYYVPFSFSWGTCVIMLIVNTSIICLTVYLPIRSMRMDMAEELQAAGE